MGNHPSGHYTLVARNKILNQVITTVHYLRSLFPTGAGPGEVQHPTNSMQLVIPQDTAMVRSSCSCYASANSLVRCQRAQQGPVRRESLLQKGSQSEYERTR